MGPSYAIRDGSEAGAYAQIITATNQSLGVFRVSSTVEGVQTEPQMAISRSGQAILTWTGNGGSEFTSDVYVQRINMPGALPPQSLNAAVIDGNLLVQGDVSRDVVRIVGGSTAGQFRVTLNGIEQILAGVTGEIRIETLGGDDVIELSNVFIATDIVIDAGDGLDQVLFGQQGGSVSCARDLQVVLGDGFDTLVARNTYIGRDQTYLGGAGNDQIYFGDPNATSFVLGMSSGARTFVSGGDGDDYLYSKYSFVVGVWNVSGGAGNDTIGAFGSAANGVVTFAGDEGLDHLVFDTNYSLGGLVLAGGAGNDRLLVLNSILPTVDLHGGADADELRALNLRSSRLSITGDQPSAAGVRDTADVRSCALDDLFAHLDGGDDLLTVYGNLVRRQTLLDGGAGVTDRLANLGNDFRLGLSTAGWELF